MSTRYEMTREQVVQHAIKIARSYRAQGLDLTLRQIYYRFVATGLSDSGQKVYKRLGDILTDARYDGSFPVEYIVDRGRNVEHGAATRCDDSPLRVLANVPKIIRGLPEFLIDTDRWYGQDTFVSVWFEKEALAGVFGPTCDELGVGWFACKGYPSVSALYDWLKNAHEVCAGKEKHKRYYLGAESATYSVRHAGTAQKCVVLYAGDHDPDGWEIPRSTERNLHKLMNVKKLPVDLTFKRIALNMDQIREYDPPPFEAKMTSARYQGYIDEHGTDDAWELDALEPTVLQELITEEVNALFDEEIFEREQAARNDRRDALKVYMSDASWFGKVFETESSNEETDDEDSEEIEDDDSEDDEEGEE